MEIAFIFFLILLNGIFAMSEIAMVSSNNARLERLAKEGDEMAKGALQLKSNPGKFLSTVQIGITLIGILTGIYSGEKIEDDLELYLNSFSVLEPYSETLAIGIIVIILTFFSLIFGELVPKRIGLTVPETVSRILSRPMHWISVIAAPFIWLLTTTTDFIVKIFNIKNPEGNHVTEDEIRALVLEGTRTGSVQEIERSIVDNVFHLGDRRVKTLMTQRLAIKWLDIHDPYDTIKEVVTGSVHKTFPVCQGDVNNIAGIVHSKEMLNMMLKNEPLELEKIIKPVLYLPETATAYQALEAFRNNSQHVALVVDEFGHIEGILTMSDLIEALLGDFAEHLHDTKEIIPRDDGSYLVDASVPFPEFTRYFNIEVPENLSKISSVGGLMIFLVKKIPEIGQIVEWNDLTLEVIDKDGKRLDKILVTYTKGKGRAELD